QTYPWKSLVDFDQKYHLPFTIKEYILAIGPIFFTGIAALIITVWKRKIELLPIVTWLLGAASGMIVFTIFPFSSAVRFIQTANHVPLAVLSVYLFAWIWQTFSRFHIKIIIFIIVIIIIGNGLVQSYFSIQSQIDFIHQRAVAELPLVPYPSQVMYPLTDFYNALRWLEIQTPRNSVVLSKITAGNYIPAYSGNFVYMGHDAETPFYETKRTNASVFFSGEMNDNAAIRFLKQEHINFIFYGPQEKEESQKNILPYSFLKPVFITPYVTIYQLSD
ncbi:MAG: hypothetical protein Q7R95_01810, partial [bacterium]|nr:hypothetical protein [bacterium]